MNKIKIHKCEQNLIKCRGKFSETRKTYVIHTTKNDEERKKRRNVQLWKVRDNTSHDNKE